MAAVLTVWTVWANTALEVNEIVISSDKLDGSYSGFRIAHVSDLHSAELGDDHEKTVNALKESNVDIIVITGDLIDASDESFDTALSFVKQAISVAPTYFVTGNHEGSLEKERMELLEEELEILGVKILRNTYDLISNDYGSICIAGIDDPVYAGTDSYITAENIDGLFEEESYKILLSHRPEMFEIYAESSADLVLCGHAHGGQIRLPFIGGLVAPGQGIFPEYDAGRYTESGTDMIVSRGIGNSIIPVRFNNRPEIVVIELRSE